MSSNGFHLQLVSGRLRPLDRALPGVLAALEGGVDSVQLRDEAASTTAALKALRQQDALDRDRIAVNGQPKEAGTFAMRWLHLPASWLNSTPPFAKFDRVGISVHSFDEAVEAEAIGADYVIFGHVFATQSHPGEAGRGLDSLAAIVEQVRIPVLAIGGIHHGNVAQVLETGCAGVSVMSAILDHADPKTATQRLIDRMEHVSVTPRLPLSPLPQRKGK